MPELLPDRFFDIVPLSNFVLSQTFDLLFSRYGQSLRVTEQVRAERQIPVTGTIGILKALCLDKTVTAEQANAILGRMVDTGFYSPVRRISDIL